MRNFCHEKYIFKSFRNFEKIYFLMKTTLILISNPISHSIGETTRVGSKSSQTFQTQKQEYVYFLSLTNKNMYRRTCVFGFQKFKKCGNRDLSRLGLLFKF